MAISIQLPSHQLATPIFSQMAAKAYGCLNESEAVGSGWVLEGRKGARTPLPKTTRDTILGNAQDKSKQKNPGKTWLSEILRILRVKADFHSTWMCGFFLVPRRQEGTEWWAHVLPASEAEAIYKRSTNGEQGLPASVAILWTAYLHTMSSKRRDHLPSSVSVTTRAS